MTNKTQNETLLKFRNQIDFFDSELVNLLHERLEIVKLVWEYKKKNNIEILQEDRFKDVLEKVTNQADELGMNPILAYNIWDMIHEEALNLEK